MNQKIPFHELSARIATTTGISEESAEQFVKNFFDLIFESLIKGESVKVKGLGAFNLIDINGEKSIEFLADKDITDVINAPFAMFEPVKLNASVSEEMLTQAYSNTEDEEPHVSIQDESVSDFPSASDVEETIDGQSATNVSSTTPVPVTPENPVAEQNGKEEQPITVPEQETKAEKSYEQAVHISEPQIPSNEPEGIKHPESEPTAKTEIPTPESSTRQICTPTLPVKPVVIPSTPKQIQPLEDEDEEYVGQAKQPSGNGNFWTGMLVGIIIGLALGACGVYLAIDYFFPTVQRPIAEQQVGQDEIASLMTELLPDSITTQPTVENEAIPDETSQVETPKATEEPKEATSATNVTVTDTIRRGYLIPDMAKKFFGSKDYWVYIYEENKSKIGNPNNTQPGQVLVIPAAEKYGIVPDNAASLQKARVKATEILRKYPR